MKGQDLDVLLFLKEVPGYADIRLDYNKMRSSKTVPENEGIQKSALRIWTLPKPVGSRLADQITGYM